MTFSEKIQYQRKQQNISQEQLAEQMHVTRQAVSKWEMGESLPDVENIVRLSEIFGVSLDYLMKDDQQQTRNENQLIDSLSTEDDDASSLQRLKNMINPAATIIFLALGFFAGMWHPGWIIFVVAWLLKKFIAYSETGKWSLSLGDAALATFLIIGFVFSMWTGGFFILFAAWCVEDAVKPTSH